LAFVTSDPIEDNENQFCSLWTTFQRIDDCANLFLNDKLNDDYFFNKLNRLDSCLDVGMTLDKASDICAKNECDLYVHIPDVSHDDYLTDLLRGRGFKTLDKLNVLKTSNQFGSRNEGQYGRPVKIEVHMESELWVMIFCEAFSVPEWRLETSKIIKQNIGTFVLAIARLPDSGNIPVGCMLLYKYQDVTGLYCLGVLNRYRLQGIATKLIEYAASSMRLMNTKNLIVHSLASENTIDLYKKFGFELVQVKTIFVKRL
jgi:N-acetylglutamate synthase-like GNAT family acetyltransferase